MKVDITNLRNIKSMSFEIPDGRCHFSQDRPAPVNRLSRLQLTESSIRMMLVLAQIQVR